MVKQFCFTFVPESGVTLWSDKQYRGPSLRSG
jgi:hypothetical protein